MEYLKEIDGIKIWVDQYLAQNIFKTGEQIPQLLAPGYWTTPTDSTKRSINPLEDSEFPGISRRLPFPKIKCIIVGTDSTKFITTIINQLRVEYTSKET
jgi:hypothetical protein